MDSVTIIYRRPCPDSTNSSHDIYAGSPGLYDLQDEREQRNMEIERTTDKRRGGRRKNGIESVFQKTVHLIHDLLVSFRA